MVMTFGATVMSVSRMWSKGYGLTATTIALLLVVVYILGILFHPKYGS